MNAVPSSVCPETILEKIAGIAFRLQQGGDLGVIVQGAIAEVRAMLQTDRVLIYHFLKQDDFVALESVGAEWTPILGRLPQDRCFEIMWLEHYKQGQITTIADIHSDRVDPCYAQLLQQLQVQANLVVPIFNQGKLWGLLIAHHCRSPRAWQPLDVQILQHVAIHLVIAAEQAALRQRQQHLEYRLEQHQRERHSATIASQLARTGWVTQPWTTPNAPAAPAQAQTAPARAEDDATSPLAPLRLLKKACKPHRLLERERLQDQSLFSFTPDGYLITNAMGMIQEANQTIAEQLGVSQDFLVGQSLRLFLTPPNHSLLAAHLHQRLPVHQQKTWKITFRPQHGQSFPAKVTIIPLEGRAGLRWLIQANSDRQRLAEERNTADDSFRHQAARHRMLLTIAQTMRQTQDLDQILHTTVTEVRAFLHTDRVVICRSERDGSGIIIAESVAEGWRSILGMHVASTYLAKMEETSLQPSSSQATNDIFTANLNAYHVALLEQMQVRAKLESPILHTDHVWGLLDAQQCQAPRQWTALEVELLQHLAIQIEIAIQQATLYEQVQSLNASLESQVQDRTAQLQQALEFESLLKRITDQVRDSLDEEKILQKVVQELAIALQADGCSTTIYNTDRTAATVKYAYNQADVTTQALGLTNAASADPNLDGQLLQGQYGHFCSIGQPTHHFDPAQTVILVCPMMNDQGVCGDLRLFKPAQESFNDLEVRLVQQVANQCAIALRQARLYQAAQAQVQELERLNQLKDDFLCTVSHELRSPMSSIKMATQMLEISLNPLGVLADESNAINRYFRILQEEGKREINLINDLLDLTRLEAGTEPLNLTRVALQYYIPHLAETFGERTRTQQQQITIHIPDDLPPLTTDLPYLERILTELLHNAFKYTPAQGRINVKAHATDATITIRITNTGVEIPVAERDRVFDKFYRIPNGDPWKHGGTGLGLALVKKIMAQLSGHVYVESGAGETTFVLEFRQLPEDAIG